MVSANQNSLMAAFYLLNANITFIAAVLSGESKSLRMSY